jgi:hypothetical protein
MPTIIRPLTLSRFLIALAAISLCGQAALSEANNVRVAVTKGNLEIKADADDSLVGLDFGDAPDKIVIVTTGTINGGDSRLLAEGVTGDVSITLADGDDSLSFNDLFFPADLEIITGHGSDGVVFLDTHVAGKTKIITGSGDDEIRFDGCGFGEGLTISTGGGDDSVVIGSVGVIGRATIRTGGGDDFIVTGGAGFQDDVTILTGGGNDLVRFDESLFFGDVHLNGGPDVDTFRDGGDNEFKGKLEFKRFE